MKSPQPMATDCDDIFGPPRTYPSGYSSPKTRPSMISAKYRQKEERRKILKISMNKLKKIEDPEASLCRSVLINNTMKRLQREARDEKIQKQQLHYPKSYENDSFLNIKCEFIKNEIKTYEPAQEKIIEFVENDFDTKLAEEIETVKNNLVEESKHHVTDTFTCNTLEQTPNNERFSSRKRSFDDMEDCDVQDVLSQFYMPPTPRMLTCIDDDEEVNVVDDEPALKRSKLDSKDLCEDYALNNNDSSRLRYPNQNDEMNCFRCGQVSMFGDLQSNVYHSLIVGSLET